MAKADNFVQKPSGYETARRQLGVSMRSATADCLNIVPRNTKTWRQWRGLLLVAGDIDAGTKIQRWAVRDRA